MAGIGAEGAAKAVNAETVDALGDSNAEAPVVVEAEAAVEVPAPEDGTTCTGVVKKWNADKGYGFIGPDDGSKDVFAHGSTIQQEDVKMLFEGEKVQYVVKVEEDGRLKATEVRGPDGGNLQGKWEETDEVKTGTVARWRGDKGFGFITPDEGEKDVFAHVNETGVALSEGTKVEYTEQVGDDGRIKATKVYGVGGRPLPEPAATMMGGAMRGGSMVMQQGMQGGYGMQQQMMQQQMMQQRMMQQRMMQQQQSAMMSRGYGRPY